MGTEHEQLSASIVGAPSARRRPEIVLCIDDDPGILGALERVLRHTPFKVATALGPEEGLRLARQLKPNLVVLDMMMPGMTGQEVLAKLRESVGNIPVVLLTGREPDGCTSSEPNTANVRYMRKPFQNKEVRELVERMITENRPDPSPHTV